MNKNKKCMKYEGSKIIAFLNMAVKMYAGESS